MLGCAALSRATVDWNSALASEKTNAALPPTMLQSDAAVSTLLLALASRSALARGSSARPRADLLLGGVRGAGFAAARAPCVDLDARSSLARCIQSACSSEDGRRHPEDASTAASICWYSALDLGVRI